MQITHLFLAAVATTAAYAKTPLLEHHDHGECNALSALLLPIITGYPLPDSRAVASYMLEQAEMAIPTEPCALPAATGSGAARITSHISMLLSWESKIAPEISTLQEACSDHPELLSLQARYPWALSNCDRVTWIAETVASTTATESRVSVTETVESTGTGNEQATDIIEETNSVDAAPRQTGIITAAAIMAALVAAGMY